jgi:HSP20 family molecular chaperone IbpA
MNTFSNTTGYKATLNHLFADLDNLFYQDSKQNVFTNYATKELEDGKIELSVNVLGHNPKNILLEVTDDKITIKSTKPEGESDLIKDIDFSFKLGKDYDGTKSEAQFNNGVLSITIDKKNERKAKKLSINIR